MYQPPHFREDRLDVQHSLIQNYPLGMLITAGSGGLAANPIPFVLHAVGSQLGVLQAHLARANAQAHELATVNECLVVFQGPQAYITPSWYATKRETGKVVPTWNYATVHVWGRPRVIEDEQWLRRQLHQLTQHQEQERAKPWEVGDAPVSYISGQLRGIIGIEIVIDRIEGKWKVSQNRPTPDRQGVADGLEEQENNEMLALVRKYGQLE